MITTTHSHKHWTDEGGHVIGRFFIDGPMPESDLRQILLEPEAPIGVRWTGGMLCSNRPAILIQAVSFSVALSCITGPSSPTSKTTAHGCLPWKVLPSSVWLRTFA